MEIVKQEEIESFFKEATKVLGENIRDKDLYLLLRNYGLKECDLDGNVAKNTTTFYNKWNKKFSKSIFFKPNFSMHYFPNNDFYGFRSHIQNSKQKKWIKLYVAIDYEHLQKSVNEIVSFLNSNPDFEYDMKVAGSMRSDNIVIRVKTEESANKIIEFIKNNQYISSGRNQLNPFVPNVNGVGKIPDMGGSYNDFISYHISSYLNSYSEISYHSFVEYLKGISSWPYSKEMENYFGYSQSLTNYQSNQNSSSEVVSQFQVKNEEKINALLEASVATYIKYQQQNAGYEQLFHAIKNAIENNYQLFTNENDVRNKLITKVFPQEIKQTMVDTLDLDYNQDYDLDQLIGIYIGFVYQYSQQYQNDSDLTIKK